MTSEAENTQTKAFQEECKAEVEALIKDTGIELDEVTAKRFRKLRNSYKVAEDTFKAAQEHFRDTMAELDRSRNSFWNALAEKHDLDVKGTDYAINTDGPTSRLMQLPAKAAVEEIVAKHNARLQATVQGHADPDPSDMSDEEIGELEKRVTEELEAMSDEDRKALAEKMAAEQEGGNG